MRQILPALLLVAITGCASSVLADGPAKSVVPVVNSIGMRFVPIPAGTFTMGDGNTAHKVMLTQAFQLGQYEVTQEQYEKIMGRNPSRTRGRQNPVETVSWNDAVEFCRKLSELPEEKSAGYVYRLPTEAEWEYACRAGTTTEYSFGDDGAAAGEYAWCGGNSRSKPHPSGRTTHPAGQKKPNLWSLYDMHGNVSEWCQDWCGAYPGYAVVRNPMGAPSGRHRVLRGGSFNTPSISVRSASRGRAEPFHRSSKNGFRLVRTHTFSP